MNTAGNNIDDYINNFPPEIQTLLEQMRATIKQAAPKSTEAIKYGMPTFVLNGNLVHFSACKNHIGFYPTPSGIVNFKTELSGYHLTKGAIHFPLNKVLPLEVIDKIVRFRVAENLQKAKTKKR